MASRDLVATLRLIDAELATLRPSAELEARISARLRARSRWFPPGGHLVLAPVGFAALAVGAAIFWGGGSARSIGDREAIAGGDPLRIVDDRARADAGPAREDETTSPERRRGPSPADRAPRSRRSIEAPRREAPAPPDPRAPAPPRPLLEGPIESPSAPPPKPVGERRDGARSSTTANNAYAIPARAPSRPLTAAAFSLPGRSDSASGATGVYVVSANSAPDSSALQPIPMRCRTPDEIKVSAIAECEAQGAELLDLAFSDPCDGGRFLRWKATCTAAPVQSCTTQGLGDGSTCLDPTYVKDEALAMCAAAGLELASLDVATDGCGGLITAAKITCCASPPPDPTPPSACKDDEVGDGLACVSMADLKEAAYEACTKAGLGLADLWYADGCPSGEASKAGYACCPPEVMADPESAPQK